MLLPPNIEDSMHALLYDPQTSGGLLIAVAADEAEQLRAAIAEHEGECWRIGAVEAGPAVVRVR